MRFVYVMFLAIWQLTAIPFVGLLTANTIRSHEAAAPLTGNYTVVYKSTPADAHGTAVN